MVYKNNDSEPSNTGSSGPHADYEKNLKVMKALEQTPEMFSKLEAVEGVIEYSGVNPCLVEGKIVYETLTHATIYWKVGDARYGRPISFHQPAAKFLSDVCSACGFKALPFSIIEMTQKIAKEELAASNSTQGKTGNGPRTIRKAPKTWYNE